MSYDTIESDAVPRFKVPQKVQHEKFGTGQTIAYDSESRKYTVEFGVEPTIKRRVDGSELAACAELPSISHQSLADWMEAATDA